MPYTVTKLITNAYYLSGIVSREFETASGAQFTDGLDSLNDLLGDKTVESGLIPYFRRIDLIAIPNVAEYFIPNLIEVETFTFFINSVRYCTLKNSRAEMFGSARAENIQSLMFNWHTERTFNQDPLAGPIGEGSTLFVYFRPDSAYPMQIWGTFGLEEVALNDDLSLVYGRFYIDYLKYSLARRICDNYNFIVPQGVLDRIDVMESNIENQSAQLDMKQQIISTLHGPSDGFSWADVNIGHGWRPPQ
jgi:hypothetical protein